MRDFQTWLDWVSARRGELAAMGTEERGRQFKEDRRGEVFDIVPFWLDGEANISGNAARGIVRSEHCVAVLERLNNYAVPIGAWTGLWSVLGSEWQRVVSGETFELRARLIAIFVEGVAKKRWGTQVLDWLAGEIEGQSRYLREIDGVSLSRALKQSGCKGLDAQTGRRLLALVEAQEQEGLKELLWQANRVGR